MSNASTAKQKRSKRGLEALHNYLNSIKYTDGSTKKQNKIWYIKKYPRLKAALKSGSDVVHY